MATLNVGFGNQTLKLKFKAPPSFAAAGEEPSSSVSLTLVPTEQGGFVKSPGHPGHSSLDRLSGKRVPTRSKRSVSGYQSPHAKPNPGRPQSAGPRHNSDVVWRPSAARSGGGVVQPRGPLSRAFAIPSAENPLAGDRPGPSEISMPRDQRLRTGPPTPEARNGGAAVQGNQQSPLTQQRIPTLDDHSGVLMTSGERESSVLEEQGPQAGGLQVSASELPGGEHLARPGSGEMPGPAESPTPSLPARLRQVRDVSRIYAESLRISGVLDVLLSEHRLNTEAPHYRSATDPAAASSPLSPPGSPSANIPNRLSAQPRRTMSSDVGVVGTYVPDPVEALEPTSEAVQILSLLDQANSKLLRLGKCSRTRILALEQRCRKLEKRAQKNATAAIMSKDHVESMYSELAAAPFEDMSIADLKANLKAAMNKKTASKTPTAASSASSSGKGLGHKPTAAAGSSTPHSLPTSPVVAPPEDSSEMARRRPVEIVDILKGQCDSFQREADDLRAQLVHSEMARMRLVDMQAELQVAKKEAIKATASALKAESEMRKATDKLEAVQGICNLKLGVQRRVLLALADKGMQVRASALDMALPSSGDLDTVTYRACLRNDVLPFIDFPVPQPMVLVPKTPSRVQSGLSSAKASTSAEDVDARDQEITADVPGEGCQEAQQEDLLNFCVAQILAKTQTDLNVKHKEERLGELRMDLSTTIRDALAARDAQTFADFEEHEREFIRQLWSLRSSHPAFKFVAALVGLLHSSVFSPLLSNLMCAFLGNLFRGDAGELEEHLRDSESTVELSSVLTALSGDQGELDEAESWEFRDLKLVAQEVTQLDDLVRELRERVLSPAATEDQTANSGQDGESVGAEKGGESHPEPEEETQETEPLLHFWDTVDFLVQFAMARLGDAQHALQRLWRSATQDAARSRFGLSHNDFLKLFQGPLINTPSSSSERMRLYRLAHRDQTRHILNSPVFKFHSQEDVLLPRWTIFASVMLRELVFPSNPVMARERGVKKSLKSIKGGLASMMAFSAMTSKGSRASGRRTAGRPALSGVGRSSGTSKSIGST